MTFPRAHKWECRPQSAFPHYPGALRGVLCKVHGQKRDAEKSGVQHLQNTASPKQPHQKLLCSIRWGPVSSGSQEHLRRESAASTTPFCLPLQKQAVLCPRRAAGPPASGPHLEPSHPGGRRGPTSLQMVGSLASDARLRLPLSWENE